MSAYSERTTFAHVSTTVSPKRQLGDVRAEGAGGFQLEAREFEHVPLIDARIFRHRDHRFEWTRAQFATWAQHVADTYGYSIRLLPVSPTSGAKADT